MLSQSNSATGFSSRQPTLPAPDLHHEIVEPLAIVPHQLSDGSSRLVENTVMSGRGTLGRGSAGRTTKAATQMPAKDHGRNETTSRTSVERHKRAERNSRDLISQETLPYVLRVIQKRSQSFAKSLFLGDLREELIFPFPQLTDADQRKLAQLLSDVRAFSRQHIDSRRIDCEAKISPDLVDGLRKLGLFGLPCRLLTAGSGCRCRRRRVIDLLGSFDSSVAMLVAVHLGFAAQAIARFGTPEQKRYYLPKLCSGQSIGAFALAEPMAGSDAASSRTRATPCDGGYRPTGTKTWVQTVNMPTC